MNGKGWTTLFVIGLILKVIIIAGRHGGCSSSESNAYVPPPPTTTTRPQSAAPNTTPASRSEPLRVWTDYKGRTIQAQFHSRDATHVRLRKENGEIVKVRFSKLSKTDQRYIELD